MPREMTKREVALIATMNAIEEAIKESGPEGIPSGHLYAALMGHISLDDYNTIIGMLKKAGRVKESFHLLTHVG